MADLLRHPWILQHTQQPPEAAAAAAELHLPLTGIPFQNLHRVSLHGAMSCRDFSSLLPPPAGPGMRPSTLASLLAPSLSASAPSLAAAATAAMDATAGARPTTSSNRLGRPGTPGAATLAAGGLAASLPSSAFEAAAPTGAASLQGAGQPSSPAAAAAAPGRHVIGWILLWRNKPHSDLPCTDVDLGYLPTSCLQSLSPPPAPLRSSCAPRPAATSPLWLPLALPSCQRQCPPPVHQRWLARPVAAAA